MSQLTRIGSVVSTLSWKSKHIDSQSHSEPQESNPLIKPTLKRYIIVLLYGLNSGNKSFQWIQIPASTKKVVYFYGVENFVINSLSAMFLVTFLFLCWPACFIIKKMGLRNAVLVGSFGTALGAIIKCFASTEDGIVALFLGQVIVSLSEQFIFSVPSRLAAVWFPDHQVSSAVAMCIFGNQFGNALGFIVPQLMLDSANTKDEISESLYKVFFAVAAFSTVLFLACLILFDEAPKYAPGAARLKQIQHEETERLKELNIMEEMTDLMKQSINLLKNRDYNMLTVVYGIMVGMIDALSTILNQMLEPFWPDDDIFVGNVGSLMIIAGVIGLPLWGRVMDALHCYRLINIFLTLATTISLSLFAYVVSYTHSALAVYVSSVLIGFFFTGIMAAGLEFAVELTYPAPELVTSSFMSVQPQIFGIMMIYISSSIVDNYGAFSANLFLIGSSMVALIMLPMIRETLNRQNAVCDTDLDKQTKTNNNNLSIGKSSVSLKD